MARSPALREALTVTAAAAAAWLVVVAALYQVVPTTGTPRGARLRSLPSHERVAGPAWVGAPRVYDELDRRARGVAPEERVRIARAILEEAAKAELAPLLVLAVIQVESRFDPRAVSPVGAVGLMQLMPPTFRETLAATPHRGADPFDPVANVRAGVRYLGRLARSYSDVQLALVAYNAGPGRVRGHVDTTRLPARFLAYPREVLRQVTRLGLDGDGPVLHRELRVAAAHLPPPPSRPATLALRDGGARGIPSAVTVAALGAGAAHAGAEALASAAEPARALAQGDVPPCASAWCAACVRIDFALPMGRGRERNLGWSARSAIVA